MSVSAIAFGLFAFILAGFVKGVSGMGLPTVSIGLLGLIMAPADAAALLVVPSLITNVWQFTATPGRAKAAKRLWPFLLMVSLTTVPSVLYFSGFPRERAGIALGAILIIYAGFGLSRLNPHVSPKHEFWLAPLMGGITGVIAGATGVFVMPGVPYMQALKMDREELVQALGLSFTVATVALGAGLALSGHLHTNSFALSLACTVPAFVGMSGGQWLRARISARTFRLVFFLGMLLLGADLALRGLMV
jgi:uncharacterized protein